MFEKLRLIGIGLSSLEPEGAGDEGPDEPVALRLPI